MRIGGIIAFALLGISSAHSEPAEARRAAQLYFAYVCAVYAERVPDPVSQERLLKFGYDQGRAFLKAVREGRITEQEFNAEANGSRDVAPGGRIRPMGRRPRS